MPAVLHCTTVGIGNQALQAYRNQAQALHIYCLLSCRGGSTLRQGARAPADSLDPQNHKLADRSDVISEVPKSYKIQIFRGCVPDPAGGAYSVP